MFLSWMLSTDISANRISRPPISAGGGERAEDRRGRRSPWIVGLLGERPRGVEPVHHVRAHDPADQEGAEVAPRVPGAGAERVEDDRRATVEVEDEQDDQQGGPDQLDDHAEVVDPGHDLDAEHVDDRGEDDQDRAEDQRVLGAVGGAVAAGVGRRRRRTGGLVDTCGSTTCQATATAATVTIEPMIRIQPVIHEVKSMPIRLDHW